MQLDQEYNRYYGLVYITTHLSVSTILSLKVHFHIVYVKKEDRLLVMKYETYINPLTHYQTTNFRHFQTERVCRRQFQI